MRYYHYLNENNKSSREEYVNRSQSITKEQFNSLLEKNCSDVLNFYDKQNRRMFRGVDFYTNYAYVDPTKSIRVSANTRNYYTILFDEILPSWKKYPKRSKSVVCTTNISKAMGYGAIFKMYPYNGSNIGQCSDGDIWDSFKIPLNVFNETLEIMANDIGYNLKEDVYNIKDFIEEVSDLIDDPFDGNSDFLREYFKSGKSFHNYLNDYFNPDKNGFLQFKTNNLKLYKNKEVWIEGSCLMEMV